MDTFSQSHQEKMQEQYEGRDRELNEYHCKCVRDNEIINIQKRMFLLVNKDLCFVWDEKQLDEIQGLMTQLMRYNNCPQYGEFKIASE